MIYSSILELIGHTPLLQLNAMKKEFGFGANIFAKLERFNPAGSIKDRVALNMILDAEKRGLIVSGATIIEPTSGNTGVGLALICAVKGYNLILTMPESMSVERRQLLISMGAKLELTPAAEGMAGALRRAEELKNEIPNSVILQQFENASNPKIHELTTGEEIWNDMAGKVDVLVATIGTGGTISGTATTLKRYNPNVEIVGVEPESSPLLTKGISGTHKIQGIGANFVPKTYNSSVVDKVLTAKDEDAFSMAKLLMKKEGVFVGISSGAAMSVAIQLAQQEMYKDKNIVVILPDTGERYLSVW
jgi:cysteine synthase A